MSSRSAACPSCGSEVLFRAGSSFVSICPSCRAAVSRKGVRLETIGTVAELLPSSSPFRIGMEGALGKTGRRFRIVGRLQLSTGQGSWDEWYVAFADGRYAWLAEFMGTFFLMNPVPPPSDPPPPDFHQTQPGMRLDFGAYGLFTVTERRQALYASAEGELPFVAVPGTVFMYADLSGADGSLATLDYGDDPGLDAFFVGQRVELTELGIPDLAGWSQRRVSARATSLNCPSCGGPLELKDPAATVRVACTYCGSLLSAPVEGPSAGKYEILARLSTPPFRPGLPLGGTGTLRGRSYVLLGALRKSCTVDEAVYFWQEYLLKETKSEAYHWLVESNGHFSLVWPVSAGKVTHEGKNARYDGRLYKHFQGNQARVEAVLGEFYWEVAQGETTSYSDYVAPPRILSMELTGEEVTWSEGEYVPPEELEKAFSLPAPLPPPEGVGANQPWPEAGTSALWWKTAFRLAAALFLLFLFLAIRGPRQVVYEKRHDLAPAGTASALGSEAEVVLSEPFEIPRTANVEAQIFAPTDNSWVFVGCDLIEETTGEVRSFGLQSDYFHGVDGGESWSEGSRKRTVFLSRVPRGRYVLRLEPETESGKAPPYYTLRLRSGVPRVWRFFLTLALIFLGPLFLAVSYARFESRRWAESDYASGSDESSSDDSDD